MSLASSFCHYTLTQEQIRLLESNSQVIGWTKAVYQELKNDNPAQIDYRRWMKCVCKYYVNYLNNKLNPLPSLDNESESFYDVLVYQTSKKLVVDLDTVRETFNRLSKQKYPLLRLEDITSCVPKNIVEKVINSTEENGALAESHFISLTLRYYILLQNEGLFLSVDPELYNTLYYNSTLPVLECYGSPFNHTIDYCSLFDEDYVYGALPTFEKMIQEINYPCRLLINPPYTGEIIRKCINLLLEYLKRVGGEFIMLLPVMYYYEWIDKICSYPNTCSHLLEKGKYTVYSAIQECDVVAPMKLYLIVNVGGSQEKSQKLLDDLVYRLRKKADATYTVTAI